MKIKEYIKKLKAEGKSPEKIEDDCWRIYSRSYSLKTIKKLIRESV